MKFQHYLLTLFIAFFFGCKNHIEKPIKPKVIPKPLFQKITNDVFLLDKNISLISENQLSEVSNYFKDYRGQYLNSYL